MAAVASRTGPLGIAIRGLFDNIGRLTTYAATFAAFLAGRWVAGMAAAALSVRGLATALVVLRGALIRTGIGALIVGAGELVYQFTRLVSGAGGFGEAMSLLKDLAVEVWERISMGAAAAGAAATAMFFDLKADAASGMQSAIESVVVSATRPRTPSRAPTRRSRRSGACCPPPSAIWRSRRPTAWSTASRRC
jgi:hypothetical protein